MLCNCITNIVETENKFEIDATYQVYMCENCKRYYIKRFMYLIEIEYNRIKSTWNTTGNRLRIE